MRAGEGTCALLVARGIPFALVVPQGEEAGYAYYPARRVLVREPGVAAARNAAVRDALGGGAPALWLLDDDVRRFSVDPVLLLTREVTPRRFARVPGLAVVALEYEHLAVDDTSAYVLDSYTCVVLLLATAWALAFPFRGSVAEDFDFDLRVLLAGGHTLRLRGLWFRAAPRAVEPGGCTPLYRDLPRLRAAYDCFCQRWPGVAQPHMRQGRPDARVAWAAVHAALDAMPLAARAAALLTGRPLPPRGSSLGASGQLALGPRVGGPALPRADFAPGGAGGGGSPAGSPLGSGAEDFQAAAALWSRTASPELTEQERRGAHDSAPRAGGLAALCPAAGRPPGRDREVLPSRPSRAGGLLQVGARDRGADLSGCAPGADARAPVRDPAPPLPWDPGAPAAPAPGPAGRAPLPGARAPARDPPPPLAWDPGPSAEPVAAPAVPSPAALSQASPSRACALFVMPSGARPPPIAGAPLCSLPLPVPPLRLGAGTPPPRGDVVAPPVAGAPPPPAAVGGQLQFYKRPLPPLPPPAIGRCAAGAPTPPGHSAEHAGQSPRG